MKSAEAQLDEFMDRYLPEVAELARAVHQKVREIVPPCLELVYDNYNALVIGFCPTERPLSAVFSIALYPRWVTLFFLQGASIEDPFGLLEGSGGLVRSVRIGAASELDEPDLRALMEIAMASAKEPYRQGQERRLVIQSVSAKQRPRRPSGARQ